MVKPKSFLCRLLEPFKLSSRKSGTVEEEDLEKIAAQEQKHFKFDTLLRATANFHHTHKLGEGGFGPVYKCSRLKFLLLFSSGYMAPEYLMHGNLSVKADVFSFGVVILELISALRNSNFSLPVDALNLLDWAYKLHKSGKSLELMDTVLIPSAIPEQVTMCIQSDPRLRPNMNRVVVMLSRKVDNANLEEPTRPGLPGSRYRRPQRSTGTSSDKGSSVFRETDSRTQNSTFNSSSASASTSKFTGSRLDDPHGKRPMMT
ncbi:hypothetical protein ACFE04_030704 [Oxalis oulophora]